MITAHKVHMRMADKKKGSGYSPASGELASPCKSFLDFLLLRCRFGVEARRQAANQLVVERSIPACGTQIFPSQAGK